MPLDYEQNGYGQPDPDAADLGLTPIADPATAPEWLLAEPPALPVVLCDDEYSVEAELHGWIAPRYDRAIDQAQVMILQAEYDGRELREQVADWKARAALEDEAIRQRDIARAAADEAQQETARLLRELDLMRKQYEEQRDLKTDLQHGSVDVLNLLRDLGYTSGTALARIAAMHAARMEALISLKVVAELLNEAELLLAQHNVSFDAFHHYGALEKANQILRQQEAQFGAIPHRSQPPDLVA